MAGKKSDEAKAAEQQKAELEKKVVEMDARAKELDQRKDLLDGREIEVFDREQALDDREQAFIDAAVAGAMGSMSEEETEICAAVCDGLGIANAHLMAANFDRASGEVVILTNGGKRVRVKPGQAIEPLSEIEITGINPKKRKPIVGQAPKTAKE